MIPWGTLGMVVIAGLMLAGTYAKGRLDGARGPTARLVALQGKYDAENAARAAAGKIREAEDERANAGLRAREAASYAALRLAEGRADTASDRAAALAAQLRAAGVGGVLPGAARRVFDDAAGAAGGSPARLRAPANGPAADAGGSPGPGGVPPDGVAAAEPDAQPVECVTVFEVGARNTAAALYNAAVATSCQRDQIALWEACTGQQYPTGALAPWLVNQP